jgi:hypothetical protein
MVVPERVRAAGAQPPTVTTFPLTNSQTVTPGLTQLTLTFSENVVIESGQIQLQKLSDGSVYTVPASSIGHTIPSKVVTITVPALGVGEPYFVVVPSTMFRTYAGRYFAGYVRPQWTFVVSGATRPTLIATTPVFGQLTVAPGTSVIELQFNVNVFRSSGTINVVKMTDGSYQSFDIMDPAITQLANGNQAEGYIIRIAVRSMDTGSAYYVEVCSTCFQSYSLTYFAGLTPRAFTFVTTGAAHSWGTVRLA